MSSISAFVPADYTVWAIAGVCFVTASADALFLLLASNCRSEAPMSSIQTTDSIQNSNVRNSTSSNTGRGSSGKATILWYPRLLMYVALAFWGASLILRLNVLWGPNSVVAGPSVTNWTSQGWLCRIFITLALGVTAPLACWLGWCILAVILCRVQAAHPSLATNGEQHVPYTRFLGLDLGYILQQSVIVSFLIVLPIAAAQSVIAWIGLTLQHDGGSIEESPTSVIGTFLAVFWYGDPTQCTSVSSVTNELVSTNEYACTMCVFPAASVIVHGVWTILYVIALGYIAYRLCSSSLLSRKIKRIIKLFVAIMCVGSIAGLACIGTSIYYNNPFEWSNQGLWLGYVATVLSSTVAISYILDDLPKNVYREIQNRIPQSGVAPPPPPIFAPVDPSQAPGTQRDHIFNPLDQVLYDPSQGTRDGSTSRQQVQQTAPINPNPGRATVP